MTTGRISKRVVDALACPAGKDREILWDAALAGFGVCAFPSGKKVYVAQFRKDGVITHPLPRTPISESLGGWIALICSA